MVSFRSLKLYTNLGGTFDATNRTSDGDGWANRIALARADLGLVPFLRLHRNRYSMGTIYGTGTT